MSRKRLVVNSVPGLALESHVGCFKARNEDYGVVVSSTVDGVEYKIIIVCDGVSTAQRPHIASRVATGTACAEIEKCLSDSGEFDAVGCLRGAIQAAHEAVMSIPFDAKSSDACPPQTTLIAAIVRNDLVTIGWVGDCRAYLFLNQGGARLLTRDHSWVSEVVDAGQMSLRDAMDDENAHVITRCLGKCLSGETDCHPDFVTVSLQDAKLLLLASDGFWWYGHPRQDQRAVPILDLLYYMPKDAEASEIARRLVDFACEQGGHDNITVAVLKPTIGHMEKNHDHKKLL